MAGDFRLGIIGYTNRSSGVGAFTYDFWKCLGADSILSVDAGIKGQEVWSDRQLTAGRPPGLGAIKEYFERYEPHVVMFVETPFNTALFDVAREYGIKTVAIPMHETFSASRLNADLVVCPCYEAWDKAKQHCKRLMFLPISVEPFPFRLREGHTFFMNVGYGWHADRRQVGVVLKAFEQIDDPEARLIIHAQQEFEKSSTDPRIVQIVGNAQDPADNYKYGDILLAPMAYEGYGRTVLEAMASGMPVLTTNADPMNLFQHDPRLLIDPCESKPYSGRWVKGATYNRVSVRDMRERLEWLLTIDTPSYSRMARRQAEAQSWESSEIDYRGTWLSALEAVCS